jgi:hypothetical protein
MLYPSVVVFPPVGGIRHDPRTGRTYCGRNADGWFLAVKPRDAEVFSCKPCRRRYGAHVAKDDTPLLTR